MRKHETNNACAAVITISKTAAAVLNDTDLTISWTLSQKTLVTYKALRFSQKSNQFQRPLLSNTPTAVNYGLLLQKKTGSPCGQ